MPRDLLIKMDEKRQGYMFILEGGSISWCSKKSDCFSLSTIKSEYIACTAAVQEAIGLINYLLCLDVTKHAYETTVIYCDNTAAILFFSTNIIPWAVQRTDHDLLLGEGMYRDKMVGEAGHKHFSFQSLSLWLDQTTCQDRLFQHFITNSSFDLFFYSIVAFTINH